MPIFSDNLDGSVGDLLRNRAGWSRPIGADEAQVITGFTGGFSLTVGTSAAASTWFVPGVQPASNDQYASGLINVTARNGFFPLGVRCNLSIATGAGYFVRHQTTGVLQLFRRADSGTLTQIGSASISASSLASNPVTIKAIGSDISVDFMGVTVIGPVADTTAATGSVAMLSRGSTLSPEASIYSWESGEVTASNPINGSLNANLDSLTASASATLPIAGAANNALVALTAAGTAKLALRSSADIVLGTLAGSGAGAIVSPIAASSNGQLGALTGAGVAKVLLQGSANIALGNLVGAGEAVSVSPLAGSAVATLGELIGAGLGKLLLRATAAATLGAVQGAGTIRHGLAQPLLSLRLIVEAKPISFQAEAKKLAFLVDADGVDRVRNLPNKAVSEVWNCELDLSPWLDENRSVSSLTSEEVTGTITVSNVALQGASKGTFQIQGGVRRGTAQFDIVGIMSSGDRFNQRFQVSCI